MEDSGDAYAIHAFQFFSRATRIVTFATADDRSPDTVAPDLINAPWENRIDGHCFRFQASRRVEDQTCVLMSNATATSDLQGKYERHEIALASGERVVIYGNNGQWTINKRATNLEFDAAFDPEAQQMFEIFGKALDGQGWFVNCLAIPDDGTRLCFLGHAPEGGDAHFAPWGSSIKILG